MSRGIFEDVGSLSIVGIYDVEFEYTEVRRHLGLISRILRRHFQH